MTNFALMRFDSPEEAAEDPDNAKVIPLLKASLKRLKEKVDRDEGQVKQMAEEDGVKIADSGKMSVKQYTTMKEEANQEMRQMFPELFDPNIA